MASTGIRTTVPPLHHLDRRRGALPPSGTVACRFFSSRKQFGNPLLTLRSPSVRSNAFVGFEPETRRGSFYDLLEVPKEVSFEEVKRAYRRLALRYHPDVSPPDMVDENARRFMEIQEAYQTLSDPVRRQVYDSALHLGGVSATTSGRWLFEEELYGKANWKRQWQDQLEKLKRRSMARESGSGINSDRSWGARMRQRWTESPIL